MPYPIYAFYKENKIANNHAIETGRPTVVPYSFLPIRDYNNQAQLRAMTTLNDYNPFGNGACPNYDFIIPGGPKMGKKISFIYGNAEVYYNSNPFSAATSDEKKIISFWLPNFIRAGMLVYDKFYGI